MDLRANQFRKLQLLVNKSCFKTDTTVAQEDLQCINSTWDNKYANLLEGDSVNDFSHVINDNIDDDGQDTLLNVKPKIEKLKIEICSNQTQNEEMRASRLSTNTKADEVKSNEVSKFVVTNKQLVKRKLAEGDFTHADQIQKSPLLFPMPGEKIDDLIPAIQNQENQFSHLPLHAGQESSKDWEAIEQYTSQSDYFFDAMKGINGINGTEKNFSSKLLKNTYKYNKVISNLFRKEVIPEENSDIIIIEKHMETNGVREGRVIQETEKINILCELPLEQTSLTSFDSTLNKDVVMAPENNVTEGTSDVQNDVSHNASSTQTVFTTQKEDIGNIFDSFFQYLTVAVSSHSLSVSQRTSSPNR